MTQKMNRDFVNMVSALQEQLETDKRAVQFEVGEFFTNIIHSIPDKIGLSPKENLSFKAGIVKDGLDDFSRALFCIVFDQDEKIFSFITEREKMGGFQEKFGNKTGHQIKEAKDINWYKATNSNDSEGEEVDVTDGEKDPIFESDPKTKVFGGYKEPEEPIDFLIDCVRKSFYVIEAGRKINYESHVADINNKIGIIGGLADSMESGKDIRDERWDMFPNNRTIRDRLSRFGRAMSCCFGSLSDVVRPGFTSVSNPDSSGDLDFVNHGDEKNEIDELERPYHGMRPGANFRETYPLEEYQDDLGSSVGSRGKDHPTYPEAEKKESRKASANEAKTRINRNRGEEKDSKEEKESELFNPNEIRIGINTNSPGTVAASPATIAAYPPSAEVKESSTTRMKRSPASKDLKSIS